MQVIVLGGGNEGWQEAKVEISGLHQAMQHRVEIVMPSSRVSKVMHAGIEQDPIQRMCECWHISIRGATSGGFDSLGHERQWTKFLPQHAAKKSFEKVGGWGWEELFYCATYLEEAEGGLDDGASLKRCCSASYAS
jgi:hypothetical protein